MYICVCRWHVMYVYGCMNGLASYVTLMMTLYLTQIDVASGKRRGADSLQARSAADGRGRGGVV